MVHGAARTAAGTWGFGSAATAYANRMLDERPNRAALRPRAAAWQLGPRIKGTGGVDAEMGDVDLV